MNKIAKIIDGTFIWYYNSVNAEIELRDSVLDGLDFYNKKNIPIITKKVLQLPINKQLYFFRCVIAEMYDDLCEENDINKNVKVFLAQDEFKKHREVIMAFVNYEEELTFNFALIDTKKANYGMYLYSLNYVFHGNKKKTILDKLEKEFGIKIVEQSEKDEYE